jgi:hypothetical protein
MRIWVSRSAIAIGGQRDGVALSGDSTRAGPDQLIALLGPDGPVATEDPRRPSVRVIAEPDRDDCVAVGGGVTIGADRDIFLQREIMAPSPTGACTTACPHWRKQTRALSCRTRSHGAKKCTEPRIGSAHLQRPSGNFLQGLPLLLIGHLLLLQQCLTWRIAAVALIDHALLALVEGFAWRIAAVAFIDHASSIGGDSGGRHRSHERDRSESGQQRGVNGKRFHLFTFQVIGIDARPPTLFKCYAEAAPVHHRSKGLILIKLNVVFWRIVPSIWMPLAR